MTWRVPNPPVPELGKVARLIERVPVATGRAEGTVLNGIYASPVLDVVVRIIQDVEGLGA